jgi:hypothetical protein
MNISYLFLLLLGGSLIGGCDQTKPLSAIPEKKAGFQKLVFTQPQSGNTVTLISETECEIQEQGRTLLAQYSRQDNNLRVVIQTGAAPTVMYFQVLPDGLRISDSDEVFLLPAPLSKAREQMRLTSEAEARAQAADAREKTAKRETEIGITKRVRTFLLQTDSGDTELRVTNGSLETVLRGNNVPEPEEPARKIYFGDLKSIRAWDDETVIINNTDRYKCKNKMERDEVIGEIKGAYSAWALRFPDETRVRPF